MAGSYFSFLNAKNAPRNVRGTLIPNQSARSANMEPNGTALEAPSYHTARFTTKNTEKIREGNPSAVSRIVFCHFVPPRFLYVFAAANPAGEPIKTKSTINAIMREPRFAGERKPNAAKTSVTHAIPKSCVAFPTNTEKSMIKGGDRNTSP